MTNLRLTAGALALAYLIGSIPFGVLIGKMKGVDPRDVGSGNIGMTNVWRALGPAPAIIVLILDALKGFAPVYLVKHLMDLMGHDGVPLLGTPTHDAILAVCVAGAAMAGHLWPIFLGFKGGKGIATGLGVFLGLDWRIALGVTIVFGLGLLLTRYVSGGSILAAISAAPLFWFLEAGSPQRIPGFCFGASAALFVLWKHRMNFVRILNGTEPKVGGRKKPPNE